jgi:hypothetical protein
LTIEIDRFFHRVDEKLIIDVMGLNYYSLVVNDLYFKSYLDEDISAKLKLKTIIDIIKNYIKNKTFPVIVLDGRGNARYSAGLCRNIAITLGYCSDKIIIMSSISPEIELNRKIENDFITIVDYSGTCNWQNFYDDLQKLNVDWENLSIDNIALTLGNRPSEYRADYIKSLLDISQSNLRVSFGTRENMTQKEFHHFKKIMEPYDFPMYIDGPVSRSPLDQHKPPGSKILSNVLQIVQESFEHQEKGIFLTEKTFKCFAWHQLPIFVATSGHVKKVRELGFDVFDDVIDHSYDEQTNSFHYKLKVLSTFKKFLTNYPTLNDCINLRNRLWPRISQNNSLLKELVRKHKSYDIISENLTQ